MSYLKLIGGLIASAILFVFLSVRLAFEIIGASTAPDDFALLKQRMPKVLEWLIGTPWPVPAILLILFAAFAAWLLWSGTKKTVEDGIADQNSLTESEVRRIVAEALQSEPIGAATPNYSAIADELQSIVDGRLNEFLATQLNATFETHTQAHGRDVKIVEIANKQKQISENLDNLTKFIDQKNESINRRLDWIGRAFASLGHWEWHKGIFPKLLTTGEELRGLSGQKITESAWLEWDAKERSWRADIQTWINVAEWYAPNSGEAVLIIHEHMFYGEWTFDESNFEKADRVKRYKDAMIILHNLKEVRCHVERGIKANAFQGVGLSGRVGKPPAGINELPKP